MPHAPFRAQRLPPLPPAFGKNGGEGCRAGKRKRAPPAEWGAACAVPRGLRDRFIRPPGAKRCPQPAKPAAGAAWGGCAGRMQASFVFGRLGCRAPLHVLLEATCGRVQVGGRLHRGCELHHVVNAAMGGSRFQRIGARPLHASLWWAGAATQGRL